MSVRPAGRLLQSTYQTLATSPHVAQVAVTSRNPLLGELFKSPVRNPQGNGILPVSYVRVAGLFLDAADSPESRPRVRARRGESRSARRGDQRGRGAALWPGADPLGKTVRVLMTQEIREDAMTHGDLVSTPTSATRARTWW